MIEVVGAHNTAFCYTGELEEAAAGQIKAVCDQPAFADCKIRIMPDVHAGMGCTIGTTMTITDKIVPGMVGVDIGCGMETIRIREKHIEMQQLDKLIRQEIPSGFAIRSKPHRYAKEIDLEALHCAKYVDLLRAEKSIGTLGGGNHFIEANKDDDGNIYIVVHSGSRHLGLQIANYYQNAAYKALTSYKPEEIDSAIAKLKAEGRQSEIQKTLQEMKSKHTYIPKPLAYVDGVLLQEYLDDMRIAQRFAMLNRKAMIDVIVKGLGVHVEEQFTTIHNYIDTEHGILRKGAVSAQAGEVLLIPINMRDGSLICVGKGNEDWNCSAPHGAGRLMSRSAAKETFTVSEFKKQMEGIYTTSVGRSTLDECPMAYKSMEDIVDNIDPTVEIKAIIKPIYNFKAGDGD